MEKIIWKWPPLSPAPILFIGQPVTLFILASTKTKLIINHIRRLYKKRREEKNLQTLHEIKSCAEKLKLRSIELKPPFSQETVKFRRGLQVYITKICSKTSDPHLSSNS